MIEAKVRKVCVYRARERESERARESEKGYSWSAAQNEKSSHIIATLTSGRRCMPSSVSAF